MKGLVERFGELIGYPERVPEGAMSFVFRVDDDPVEVRQKDGTLVFKWTFPENAPVERIAEFAVGRFLRDRAVLAWDAFRERAILWQRTRKGEGERAQAEAFRWFLGSCDWWKRCVAELVQPKARLAEMVIRP